MERPLFLWVDCLSEFAQGEQRELRAPCERMFRPLYTSQLDQLEYLIARTKPAVICFDFEDPQPSQLGAMQAIKRSHPSIPVLMLTQEHSEALAVWAFRARAWNYLVKPVDSDEWRANLQMLSRIATLGPRQRRELRMPGPTVETYNRKSRRSASSYKALMPALKHIEQKYAEPISASDVAEMCGMSPFRFSREFHSTIGNTFQDHLLRYRIAEACRLMRQRSNASIADIGAAVGFNDSSYFARIFKRYMNLQPSQFARKLDGDVFPVDFSAPMLPEAPVDSIPTPGTIQSLRRRG